MKEKCKNLSLVISNKERRKMKDKKINWGEFSSKYSLEGLNEGLKVTKDLEELGDWVHSYWLKALADLWEALDNGAMVEGGYTEEKRQSHKLMMVDYKDLTREDQLKDIYTIKDLLTAEAWEGLGGEAYEDEFSFYNIGW